MKINKRKIQYASLSTVFIALFIAVILLVNVFVGFITNRFSLKLDLTSSGQFSLSEQTKTLLSELTENVTVYLMQSEADINNNTYKSHILETVRRYNTASGGKVKYEFVDPNQNPKFYDNYPLAKANKEGDSSAFLIISGERRYDFVLYNELVSTNESQRDYYYNTEAELSSGVLYVTSASVSKAAKIIGHNERDITGFNQILSGNNIEIIDVNLRTDDIPEDVNNVIIAAPNVDFTVEEIQKIDKFLTVPGNNLYVFWNGSITNSLPILERFLSDWGMAISTSTVLDQQYAYGDPRITVCAMKENDITANVATTEQVLLAPQAHPIEILWEEKSATRVLPLAETSPNSYARLIDSNANVAEGRKDGEAQGPFNVAAVGEKIITESDGNVNANRVFLFGSSTMADESFTGISIALNNALLNTVVSYANKGTKTMAIAPKVVESNDLNFYESQIDVLLIILVVIIPLVILAAGIFIFLRRRHR